MSEREKLLKDIESFIAEHNMPETVFGVRAMNDTALLTKLRRGRSVRIDTAERLRKFMASYKPERRPKKAAASQVAA